MALRTLARITAVVTTGTAEAVVERSIALGFHGWPDTWIPGLQSVAERITRVGQSGSVRQIVGYAGREVSIPVWVAFTSRETADRFAADLEALQDQVVHLVAHGRTYPRVTVARAEVARIVATKGPPVTGTSPATHRLEATLVLEVQPESAEA